MATEISYEEALKLFRGWKDRSCRVLIGFNSPAAFQGQFDGQIMVVDEGELVVESFGSKTNLNLSIQGCKFILPDVMGDGDAFADTELSLLLCFPNEVTCSIIAFSIPN
jgi:hypothetical protein